MPATVIRTCPHCHGERQGFYANHEWEVGAHRNAVLYGVLFVCWHCGSGIVLEVLSRAAHRPMGMDGNLEATSRFEVKDEYPVAKPVEAPPDVPETIAQSFLEAVHNSRQGYANSAGMSARRALEVATKLLCGDDQKLKSMRLVDRIDALASQHVITSAMSAWAHEIRISGNDAAHDDALYEQREVEDLIEFTRVFLLYAFTLPAMVERRQARAGK